MDKNRYQYFLFDWDGTLADTLTIWGEAWEKAAQHFGVAYTYKQATKEIFGRFETHPVFQTINPHEFLGLMYTYIEQYQPTVTLNEHVPETLDKIKSLGHQIAVVTSSRKDSILPLIQKHQLSVYIDAILTREDVTKPKPDPEIVFKALERLQAHTFNTVIIGDSEGDILAGKSAGITTAVFFPERNQVAHDAEELKSLNADYFFSDFSQVMELVA